MYTVHVVNNMNIYTFCLACSIVLSSTTMCTHASNNLAQHNSSYVVHIHTHRCTYNMSWGLIKIINPYVKLRQKLWNISYVMVQITYIIGSIFKEKY